MEKLEWAAMPFKSDFIDELTKNGNLPCTSTQCLAEEQEEVQELSIYNAEQP